MRQLFAYAANETTHRIVLVVVVFFLSLSNSPGGHEIYRRNTQVIEMQNVKNRRMSRLTLLPRFIMFTVILLQL